jgi:hypothetical protein
MAGFKNREQGGTSCRGHFTFDIHKPVHRDIITKTTMEIPDFKLRRVLYVVYFLLGNSPASELRCRGFTQTKTYNHRDATI